MDGWMVRPEKWGHIVTKRPGTKRPRDAYSQGRFIHFFQGRIVQGCNAMAPMFELNTVADKHKQKENLLLNNQNFQM
jgi:hypothetical protein